VQAACHAFCAVDGASRKAIVWETDKPGAEPGLSRGGYPCDYP
jgi:hypothetical protein